MVAGRSLRSLAIMSMLQAALDWIGTNAALIVAICALAVAAYQSSATRRHNRLSVQPHVVVFANRSNENGQGRFSVVLRNSGLGPAIIERYFALLDKEPLSLRDSSIVSTTVATVIGRPAPHLGFHRLIRGDAIAKDQEVNLFSVGFACSTPQDYQAVMKSLERLSLVIEYASIYGEKFKYDSQVIGT